VRADRTFATLHKARFMSNRVIVPRDDPNPVAADIRMERRFQRRRSDPRFGEPRRHILNLPGLDTNW
jgi:hypothetical protein